MPSKKHNPADISLPAPVVDEKSLEHAHSVSSTSDPSVTFKVPKPATLLIAGLFAMGLTFYFGVLYGEHTHTVSSTSNPPSATTTASNSSFGGGGFGGRFLMRGVFGQVTAVNGDSFTVQNPMGTSTNIQTSGSTKYTGGSSVSVGDTVLVKGSKNSSGTYDATSVAINPTVNFSPFGSGGTSGSSATTQTNGSST